MSHRKFERVVTVDHQGEPEELPVPLLEIALKLSPGYHPGNRDLEDTFQVEGGPIFYALMALVAPILQGLEATFEQNLGT